MGKFAKGVIKGMVDNSPSFDAFRVSKHMMRSEVIMPFLWLWCQAFPSCLIEVPIFENMYIQEKKNFSL